MTVGYGAERPSKHGSSAQMSGHVLTDSAVLCPTENAVDDTPLSGTGCGSAAEGPEGPVPAP